MTTTLFSGRSPQTLDLLLRRRSASAKAMTGPGPGEEDIALILAAGARVPDHGKLAPWRFIRFDGDSRAAFGEALAELVANRESDASPVRLETERTRFSRAPLVIAVISSPKSDKPIPEWEQRLSAAAVCQNMLIAATALGHGAQWLTEWYAYDPDAIALLRLGAHEKVAGFLFFGQPAETLVERERPSVEQLVSRWSAPAKNRPR